MTNEQLCLVIGIHGVIFLVGILVNAVLYVKFNCTLNAGITAGRLTGMEKEIHRGR